MLAAALAGVLVSTPAVIRLKAMVYFEARRGEPCSERSMAVVKELIGFQKPREVPEVPWSVDSATSDLKALLISDEVDAVLASRDGTVWMGGPRALVIREQ